MGLLDATALRNKLLIAALLLFITAVVLLRYSLFGRRRGSTRHCRRCLYNLQGISSDRCPECGLELVTRNIVQGIRRRRSFVAVFAIFFLLMSVGLAIFANSQQLLKTDWYSYKPTTWVISDLKSSNRELYEKAWNEIQKRIDAKNISADQKDSLYAAAIEVLTRTGVGSKRELLDLLIDHFEELAPSQKDLTFDLLLAASQSASVSTATDSLEYIEKLDNKNLLSSSEYERFAQAVLAVQISPQKAPHTRRSLVNLLGQGILHDKVSPELREQYFNQSIIVTLTARREMTATEVLPYEIRVGGFGPEDSWRMVQHLVTLSVDGKTLASETLTAAGPLMHDVTPGVIKIDQPGEHILTIVLKVDVYFVKIQGEPVWTHTFTVTAPFTADVRLP